MIGVSIIDYILYLEYALGIFIAIWIPVHDTVSFYNDAIYSCELKISTGKKYWIPKERKITNARKGSNYLHITSDLWLYSMHTEFAFIRFYVLFELFPFSSNKNRFNRNFISLRPCIFEKCAKLVNLRKKF